MAGRISELSEAASGAVEEFIGLRLEFDDVER